MFSKDLEYTIGQCYKRAREARHEFMTVEHLLLALLDNSSAETVLRACGADFARLRGELEQAIGNSSPTWARTTAAIPSPRSVSSAYCSARSTTCSPPARRR